MEPATPLSVPRRRQRDRGADGAWSHHVGHAAANTRVRGRGRRVRGRDQPLVCVHDSGFRTRRGKRERCQRARQRSRLCTESGRYRAFQPRQRQGLCLCSRLCGRDIPGDVERRGSPPVLRAARDDRRGVVERPVRRLHADRFRQLVDEQLDVVSATGREQTPLYLRPRRGGGRRSTGRRTSRSRTTALPPRHEPESPFPAMTGWPFRTATSISRTSAGRRNWWRACGASEQHLAAVANLLEAIASRRVDAFLDEFNCPTLETTSTSLAR